MTKVASAKQRDHKCADAKCKDVACGFPFEITDAAGQDISDDGIKKPPQNVNGRQGKPFIGWLCKRCLKRLPHNARNEMGNNIGSKCPPEKVSR